MCPSFFSISPVAPPDQGNSSLGFDKFSSLMVSLKMPWTQSVTVQRCLSSQISKPSLLDIKWGLQTKELIGLWWSQTCVWACLWEKVGSGATSYRRAHSSRYHLHILQCQWCPLYCAKTRYQLILHFAFNASPWDQHILLWDLNSMVAKPTFREMHALLSQFHFISC